MVIRDGDVGTLRLHWRRDAGLPSCDRVRALTPALSHCGGRGRLLVSGMVTWGQVRAERGFDSRGVVTPWLRRRDAVGSLRWNTRRS